jgi:hypothetical protein
MQIQGGVTITSGITMIFQPGAPTVGTATATGVTTATISFTAPSYNGGSTITSYTAVSSPGGITAVLNQSGSGTITVTGLSSATTYTFVVYATNSIGQSANSQSSNSITTQTAGQSWAVSSTDPIISWSGGGITRIFAILSNGTDTNQWQYAPSPWTSWTNFGAGSNTYVAVAGGIYWNGQNYSGFVKSTGWNSGNPSYKQRYPSSNTFGFATYMTDEVTAFNNNNYTGPTS